MTQRKAIAWTRVSREYGDWSNECICFQIPEGTVEDEDGVRETEEFGAALDEFRADAREAFEEFQESLPLGDRDPDAFYLEMGDMDFTFEDA